MSRTHWYSFYCQDWIYGDKHTAEQDKVTCKYCLALLRDAELQLEPSKSIQAASFEEEKCPNCHEYDCRCADYDRAQLS